MRCVSALTVLAAVLFAATTHAANSKDRLFFDTDPTSALNDDFAGFGFNIDLKYQYTDQQWNEVIGKRLTESNFGGLSRVRGWSPLDYVPNPSDINKPKWWQPTQYRALDHLHAIDNDVFIDARFDMPDYMGGGVAQTDQAKIRLYAQQAARGLGHLVNGRGYDNVRWWSLTNELSTNDGGNWFGTLKDGAWQQRMPIYGQYVTAVREELDKLGGAANVQIVGGDSYGVDGVLRTSLPYIRDNLDSAVGAYGYHHYPKNPSYWPGGVNFGADNGKNPGNATYWNNPDHYHDWVRQYQLFRKHSMNPDKPLIIGEWGSGGDGDGSDRITTFLGIDDAEHALFSASRMIAALNGGVDGYSLWELHDAQGSWNYREHGWFRGERDDWEPRPSYQTVGLISKFVKKNATVLAQAFPGNNDPDENVHAAIVQHHVDGSFTIVITNRGQSDYLTDIRLLGDRFSPNYVGDDPFQAKFRRYVIDPRVTPDTAFGDLQDFTDEKWYEDGGIWNQLIPAGATVIYTTSFDEPAPAPVEDLEAIALGDAVSLRWRASEAEDLAYYRIYRFEAEAELLPVTAFQIGSTIATSFLVADGDPADTYRVTAVDHSGNESFLTVIPEPSVGTVFLTCLFVLVSGRSTRQGTLSRRTEV